MPELTGSARRVGRASFLMRFHLPMQITERPWVMLAPFLEQQMGALPGFTGQVGDKEISFLACPLRTQILEQSLVTVEPFSERQMGGTLGLDRQAERPTRLAACPLRMRIKERLWVSLAES